MADLPVTLVGCWKPYPVWVLAEMLGTSDQEIRDLCGDTPWALETLLGPVEIRSAPPPGT